MLSFAVSTNSETDLRLPTLEEISSYAFGVNLFFSNLMRISVLGPILRIPVGVFWLIGYGAWYLESLINGQTHPHKGNGWYTFAEFKTQNEIAALVGTIAAILLLVAPELIVPIAWLFAISNVFWAIAAHHKSNVIHPEDDNYSTDKQKMYSYLCMTVTSLSLITAVAATLMFFLPFTAPVAMPILTGVGIILICANIGIGLKWHFGTYQTDKEKRELLESNQTELQSEFTFEMNIVPKTASSNERSHFVFPSPLQSPDKSPTEIPLAPANTPLARENNYGYSSPII